MPEQRGVPIQRVRSVARRLATSVATHGPVGVARAVRERVRRRWMRVIATSRGNDGLVVRLADRVARRLHPALGGAVRAPVTAAASLASAEALTRSLRPPPAAPARLPATPTVGVVVPAHRDGGYLAAALESVRAQSYRHWRCVVVDDASPEDLAPVVASFRSDPRFTYVRHAANGGLPAARNTGLRHLDTDMVVFLDADDMLAPSALAQAVATLAPLWPDPAVAGVHGHVIQVPDEAVARDLAGWRGRVRRGTFDWARYGGEVPFAVHGVVLRRWLVDAFGGFDEALSDGAEDWDLWFRMLRHGYRFEPTDRIAGAYRQRRASMIRTGHAAHIDRAARLFEAAEQWALLDPELTVGRGAAAPLSRTRLGLERARRTASVVAMEITADASIEPLARSSAFDLLDPEGLTDTRWNDVVEAARNGAARGLGLSRALCNELSPVAQDRIVRVARAVADEIYHRPVDPAVHDRGFDATARWRTADVLAAAETVADVVALRPLLAASDPSQRVAAVDLEVVAGASGANDAWRAARVDLVPYHHLVGALPALRRLLVCSPVGPVVADLLAIAERSGVECHVVRVPGRPAALTASDAATFETRAVTPEQVLDALGDPPPHRDGPPAVGGWRGADFPARLPLEDGPLDPASVDLLRALHNRHAGETAVIIGNGPSLNETELEILTDVPTFGVNAVFLAAERFPRPIAYYVVEDTAVFHENLAAIKSFEADWKLFPAMYRSSFEAGEVDEHTIFFRMNAGFYGRNTGTTCHPRFSTDATQRLYCGQSVTIINLQLAHWMGFKRVVLIGMDFSYRVPDDADRDGVLIVSRSDDPNHFHPDYFGAGRSWKDPMLDRVLVNYHLAEEVYRATGREIVNATEGGKLDVFPRMSLREAIGYGR